MGKALKRIKEQQVKYLVIDKHGRIIGRSTTLTGAKRKIPYNRKGQAQASLVHVDKVWGMVTPTKKAKKTMGKIEKRVTIKKRRKK